MDILKKLKEIEEHFQTISDREFNKNLRKAGYKEEALKEEINEQNLNEKNK